MTQEQKARAYDKVSKEVKDFFEGRQKMFSDVIKTLEYLFPELKESEDERIRKELIAFLKENYETGRADETWSLNGIERWIAWLKKQGEQKSTNIVPIPDGCHAYIKDRKVYIENYTKTTPANKVEPKFKAGNWYQCTEDFLGKGVTFDKNTAYYCAKEGCLQNEYGCHIAIVKDLYDNFKLWTIDDARDGDILANDKSVFIYAKVLYNKPYAYCGVDKFGVFKDNCLKYDWSNSVDNIHPATKEQRDTLFTKMKESGYEFDFETKELKKIDTYCQENCKGFQETGRCFCDGECKAKKEYIEHKDKQKQDVSIQINPSEYINDMGGNGCYLKNTAQASAWSKNDEYNVQCLIAKVTYDIQKGNLGRNQELIDWLKTLKYRMNND